MLSGSAQSSRAVTSTVSKVILNKYKNLPFEAVGAPDDPADWLPPKRNWFMKRLANWVNKNQTSNDLLEKKRERECENTFEGYAHNERSIKFAVYFAQGGRIVETRCWDKNRSEWRDYLHIITCDQNFSEEIDKIITVEGLR